MYCRGFRFVTVYSNMKWQEECLKISNMFQVNGSWNDGGGQSVALRQESAILIPVNDLAAELE